MGTKSYMIWVISYFVAIVGSMIFQALEEKMGTPKKISNESDLSKVSPEDRDNKEFVINVIHRHHSNFKYVSDRLKNDKDVARAASNGYWDNMKYVSDELKDDEEFILERIYWRSPIIRYISERLLKSSEFLVKAVKVNYKSFGEFPLHLREDFRIILACLKIHPKIVRYIPDNIWKQLSKYKKRDRLISYLETRVGNELIFNHEDFDLKFSY